MIILLTGSREWPWPPAVHYELDQYFGMLTRTRSIDGSTKGRITESLILVHGGAPGVDTFGKDWAILRKKSGDPVDQKSFRPNYEKHSGSTKRAAPKIRNQDMVNYVWKHSDPRKIVLAFQYGSHSGGTQDCMERAEFAGLDVRVHYLTFFDR